MQKATQSIWNLKKHIMRCKNQDLARTHLFEKMPYEEVLLICDWAMKFLPRKFREDQCDWFGKRGIPWHICMAFCRRDDGSIGSLGFVHLFANQISQVPVDFNIKCNYSHVVSYLYTLYQGRRGRGLVGCL